MRFSHLHNPLLIASVVIVALAVPGTAPAQEAEKAALQGAAAIILQETDDRGGIAKIWWTVTGKDNSCISLGSAFVGAHLTRTDDTAK